MNWKYSLVFGGVLSIYTVLGLIPSNTHIHTHHYRQNQLLYHNSMNRDMNREDREKENVLTPASLVILFTNIACWSCASKYYQKTKKAHNNLRLPSQLGNSP